MKVFVTGAGGYIGGAVARRLRRAGHHVIGLVRTKEASQQLKELSIEPVRGSLEDVQVLHRASKEADAIVNAADADHAGAIDTLLSSLVGSGKVLLHTSGSSLVGDRAAGEPSELIYSEDTPLKLEPEMRGRHNINQRVAGAVESGVRSIIFVPSMVYGDGGSIQVPMLIEQARRDGIAKYIGRGLNRRSNVHIDDLADLYLRGLESNFAGETFYVGAAECTLRDIAVSISGMLGFGGRSASWTVEEASKVWGARLAGLTFGNNSRVSSEKARKLLGWKPMGVDLLSNIEQGSYAKD